MSVATRVIRWLWWSRDAGARVARTVLLPAAGLHRAAMVGRAAAYRRGWRRAHRLGLPAVAVGNLAVGGTGKTPLAAWIARYYAASGRRPGILLRGYGRDEELVHRRLVPDAVVVPDPDRRAGAQRARELGADVLVLDDAFQRLDVARDLNVVVLSAEQEGAAPWPLPAGPWREGWAALRRAHVIVVTRRDAAAGDAARLAQRVERATLTPSHAAVVVARLVLAGLAGMRSGQAVPLTRLAGHRVLAAAGVADPAAFAAQLRGVGADVRLLAFGDHHAFPARDVQTIVGAGAEVDYVVVTEKDAVKLRPRWPAEAPEPLVAALEVEWERNGDSVEHALASVLAPGGP